MPHDNVWAGLLVGYLLTVLIETPVLIVALAPRHPLHRKVFAGLWLTACTYPVVFVVLPAWMRPLNSQAAYLVVAETFAPLAECAIFSAAFGQRTGAGQSTRWRDWSAIVAANLLSFGFGEVMNHWARGE